MNAVLFVLAGVSFPTMQEEPSPLTKCLLSQVGSWTSLVDQSRSVKQAGAWKAEAESPRFRVTKRTETRIAFTYGKSKTPTFELESKGGVYEWITYDKATTGESGKAKVVRVDYVDDKNWIFEIEWEADKNGPAGFSQGVMMGRYFTWTEGKFEGAKKVITGFSVSRRRS